MLLDRRNVWRLLSYILLWCVESWVETITFKYLLTFRHAKKNTSEEVSPFSIFISSLESFLSKNKEIRNRKVVAHSIEDTAFSLRWKSYVKQNAQWRLMDPKQVHALLPKCFVWQINFPITRWGEKWCGLIAPPWLCFQNIVWWLDRLIGMTFESLLLTVSIRASICRSNLCLIVSSIIPQFTN